MSKNRRNKTSEDLKSEVIEKINHYSTNDFPEARRIHDIIMEANPSLQPRLWYGMPGYAKTKDSAVLCFFRKDALISFGITEAVDLNSLASDAPSAVASSWYITKLDAASEKIILETVNKISRVHK